LLVKTYHYLVSNLFVLCYNIKSKDDNLIKEDEKTFLQLLLNYIKYSVLRPIIFISFSFLLIYIVVTGYIMQENRENILNTIRISLLYSVNRESKTISEKIKSIENSHNNIYAQVQHFYKHRDKYEPYDKKTNYRKNKFGLLYQEKDGDSSVGWAFLFSKLRSQEILEYLKASQWLDIPLQNAVKDNIEVQSSWILDDDGLCRFYPYIDVDVFPSDLDNLDGWNFYYEAKEKYNPTKKPLWSSIYFDPAGQGWTTSYIAPIYDQSNKFRAVVGLDIPIKKLSKNILPDKIPFDGEVFLTNSKGMILGVSDKLSRFLDLTQLKKNKKGELVPSEILKPREHNLLNHPNKTITMQFQNYFENNLTEGEFVYKGETFFVEAREIQGIEWKVFFLFDKRVILEDSLKIQENLNQILLYLFIVIGILLLLFLLYIYRQSKFFAQQLSKPIIELALHTQNIDEYTSTGQTNIKEVGILLKNFDKMVRSIKLNRENLEKEVEERTKELKLLSSIDPLTKLYNRRSLTEMSNHIFKSGKRNGYHISTIMLDIDFFKKVNDTYGHSFGDVVLVKLADLLIESTRESDVVCRWGGEEFIIVLENTDIEGAFVIAEKIRVKVENTIVKLDDGRVFYFTISLGVDEVDSQNDSNIEASIIKADKLLYEAKNNGRNRVCCRSF